MRREIPAFRGVRHWPKFAKGGRCLMASTGQTGALSILLQLLLSLLAAGAVD